MTTLAVTLTLAVPAAQADGSASGAAPTSVPAALKAAPEKCPSAHRAVKFYAGRIAYWRDRMGNAQLVARTTPRGREERQGSAASGTSCPRYLAHILQRKAYAARATYKRWFAYHYKWENWLPDKWQRIGACETGYGKRPGNWRHSNSAYEGAFGFAKTSWDSFKYRADRKAGPYPEDAWQATPRQQYEVALAIYRAFGFSGWGCRGA